MPAQDPGTGYYLALTFGTLLSSQGADAHEPGLPGFVSRRLLVCAAQRPPPQGRPAAPDGVSRGAERKLRASGGGVKPVAG